MNRLVLIALLGAGVAQAAVNSNPIPRTPARTFLSQALYHGGNNVRANLETLRLAQHTGDNFERWVMDFSDPRKRTVGTVAPLFQIQYHPAEKLLGDDLLETPIEKPAKFIFILRAIERNFLTRQKVTSLVKKSRYVKEIKVYPPIEGGDMAIEFVLKRNVKFEPHQPREKEGRLVLDLRASAD